MLINTNSHNPPSLDGPYYESSFFGEDKFDKYLDWVDDAIKARRHEL